MVIQSSNAIKSLPLVDLEQLEQKKVKIPSNFKCKDQCGNPVQSKHILNLVLILFPLEKRKTMIFDIDETLIHRITPSDKTTTPDVYINVPQENGKGNVKVLY